MVRARSYAYANLTVDEATTKLVVLGSGYKKYAAPSQAVRLRWRDPRLNLTFFRKNSFVALPSYLEHEIWTPRLTFLDVSEVRLLAATADDASRITRIYEDGTIADTRRYVFRVSCAINLDLYPLDTQRCPFRIKLQRHTESTAQLHWISVFKTGEEDVVWLRGARLHTITLSTSKQTLESIAGPQRCLLLQFAFRRNPWPHLLSTWLPSAMLVPVAWARLWYPGGGLYLPCAALAGLTLHSTQFKAMLRGHDLLTAMDVWLLICLGFVLGAFFDYLIVCNANQRAWSVQKLTEDNAADDCSRTISEQVYVADGYRLTHEAGTQTPPDVGLDEARHDRRAWLVFVIGFPFVTVVYWAYYLTASR
ncbi:gamma-aminobutyric acid receptor subunit pi-like [Dermacentor silvarum]|uniref:gamma-aminobutyric acid receptor subunit pi-like n=1 Tax=Dermacentor silvarum TaxID=543639 RepID=UPI002101AC63|nr:gamma-aminobutyric acid receptor subunit pi-like [Dermacentor silvarum]